ncbi:MAG: AmmeMemoRadiSam system protein B [Chloroflexota bacterium]
MDYQGQRLLLLQDRLDIAQGSVGIPPALVPLLALCDGTRDEASLCVAYQHETGIPLSPANLAQVLDHLDLALLLESPRFADAYAGALSAYRDLPSRPSALSGRGYPEEPAELAAVLASFCSGLEESPSGEAAVQGLICPHIDYGRGGRVYARTWLRAAGAARAADMVLVFGTDHVGSAGMLTLTRQRYATPWGPLPLATEVVDALADVLGDGTAFAEELHHRTEHSLELAINWLHYVLGDRRPAVLPVLCGSFHKFTDGSADPGESPRYDRAVAAVREATRGKRVLVVAAADFAHVGPAFDDPAPIGPRERAALRVADERRLVAACTGDAAAFFAVLREEGDRQRVCGLPPIYFALRLLDGAKGEVVTYDQCPAESDSVVSIAGVVYK